MSRTLRIGLSIVLSLVFLGFAVRNVDWAEAGRALAGARYVFIVPIVFVTFWTLYIRAQRWRLFLRPVGVPPMRSLVAGVNIGFMANMVLPLRIGEVIRPVLVSRRERMPLSPLLATIVLERIFDLFTVVFLFGVSSLLVPVSDQARSWGYRLTAIAVMMGGGVALVRWQEQLVLRVIHVLLRALPEKPREAIEHFIEGFITALEVLDRPTTFLLAFAWSLYLWIVIALAWLLGIWAFALPVPNIVAAVTVTVMVAIAVAAPSAPGYVGALQLGCVLALSIFGVKDSEAIAYSFAEHVAQFVGIVLAGLYSLWSEGMSFKQLEAVSEEQSAPA